MQMKKLTIVVLILVLTGISYAKNSLRAEKETIKIVKTGNVDSKYFEKYIDVATRELSKRFIVKSTGYTDKILGINLFKEKGRRTFDLICFIKDNNSGVEKKFTVGLLKSASIVDFGGRLLIKINKLFPIRTRITEIENDNVIFDIGYDLGVKKRDEFDIVNTENKKIGLAIVINVENDESTAKIIRGQNKIEEGNFLRYRPQLNKSFSLRTKIFPTNIKINPLYEEETGDATSVASKKGTSTIFTWGKKISNVFELNMGTGLVSAGEVIGGWEIFNLSLEYNKPLIKDYINLEVTVGSGIAGVSGMSWARNPDVNYGDGMRKNSGRVDTWFCQSLDIYSTLHLFPVRNFSFSFSTGFYGLVNHGHKKWTDRNGEKDDEGNYKDYGLKDEWLEYDIKSVGGLMFSFGINYWFPDLPSSALK